MLVSYSPEQEMETIWERALIPLVYCRLASHFSFARVNNPQLTPRLTGSSCWYCGRSYQSVGGHASVAEEILEDVALARRVKQSGHKIYFAAAVGIVSTRMYRSFSAMWQGWTKNLYPLMGATPAAVFGNSGLPLRSLLWRRLLCFIRQSPRPMGCKLSGVGV